MLTRVFSSVKLILFYTGAMNIVNNTRYCFILWCTFDPNSVSYQKDEQFLQFSGLGFVTLGPLHCA